jgi:MoaA/NifB/PqqE/SkfB family radical SAM enzyme
LLTAVVGSQEEVAMLTGSTRQAIRVGWQVATEHPSLVLWYLRNRMRTAALPLERAFADGRSLAPRFVTLKPTLRCNLRCDFCRFVANGDVFGKADWLSIEDWKRIIDEIAPFQPYICITGGEPTMYPQIAQLVAHIKDRGMTCVLTTNGTMLAHRAEELLRNPPDIIILSIDGPRDVHDAVRMVDGTYDRAMKGVQVLHRLKEARGSRLPYLVTNSAITGRTYENTVELIDVAKAFGAFAMNFQHFWFLTQGQVDAHNQLHGDCFPLDFDHVGGTFTEGVETDRLYDVIEQVKRDDHGFPIIFYPELTREQMRTYYADPNTFTHHKSPDCAWISTDILPNGDVSPCFDLICGNLLQHSFMEIWNNDVFRSHRNRLAHDGPYPVCSRCCAYFRHD